VSLHLRPSRAQRIDRLRDRLRTEVGLPPPSVSDAAATQVAGHADSRRAEELARMLGGHVVRVGAAAVTVVETRTRLPADLRLLQELPDPVAPDRPILCLDTETTGLGTAAGTVPFLVGLGRWQGDEFVVRQLMLPDHPDERAMLEVLEQHIPVEASLVTYNGRAFDWPLITSRYRLHGRPPPPHAAHLDLLGLARQVWRHRLPDARLASVEAGICGVRRHGDLPGALIPERYFGWLRTGRAEPLREVLAHNHQDVVSLALLLRVLAHDVLPERTGARALRGVTPRDLAGLGRLYARRGRAADALACFEQALERMTAPGRDRDLESAVAADRARALGRLGRRADAASAWEAVALEGGPMAAAAWIAVAKSREHVTGDHAGALAAARRADVLAFRSRFLGRPQPLVERDLTRRLPRLVRLARVASASAASAA
jgi:uncharacterized protein YprB with RNaseH-like and TPR domain